MTSDISVTDYVGLVQLRHRYCHYVDNEEYERWARLFTEDGSFDIASGETYTGYEELVKFGTDVFDDLYEHQAHTVSNPVLQTEEDEGSGMWYLFMPHITSAGEPGLVQGRYNDRYERVDGEWKLASVGVTVDIRETF